MLTTRMQIQRIADRLAGLDVQASAKDFGSPWLLCWQALENAQPGKEQEALSKAIEGLPEQKDILEAILSTRPGFRPSMPSLGDIAPDLKPIEWVWYGWIPRGMITVLGASQGSGKSFVATDLAWRVIHDKGFPDGAPVKRPGAGVLYVDAEMVPQILNQRCQYYQLDRDKLYMLLPEPGEMLDLGKPFYRDRLKEMADELHPELIIIDSLSSVHTNGQNNVEDVRSLIGYLVQLVKDADCGLVLIHHIRKPPGGQRMMEVDLGMEDLMGSGYITQQARVVLGMYVVKTGPEFDPNGPREFKVLKNNLGRYPDPVGFNFVPMYPEGVRLEWSQEAPSAYKPPTQLDFCKEWLEDLLQDVPEGIRVKEIVKMGEEQGFSRPTIFRARDRWDSKIESTEGHKSPRNRWKWAGATTQEEDAD